MTPIYMIWWSDLRLLILAKSLYLVFASLSYSVSILTFSTDVTGHCHCMGGQNSVKKFPTLPKGVQPALKSLLGWDGASTTSWGIILSNPGDITLPFTVSANPQNTHSFYPQQNQNTTNYPIRLSPTKHSACRTIMIEEGARWDNPHREGCVTPSRNCWPVTAIVVPGPKWIPSFSHSHQHKYNVSWI